MKAEGLKDDPGQPLPCRLSSHLGHPSSSDLSMTDYLDSSSPDLLMVSKQQMLGQQLTGLGLDLLTQAPDRLILVFAVQIVTDMLVNIMAGTVTSESIHTL